MRYHINVSILSENGCLQPNPSNRYSLNIQTKIITILLIVWNRWIFPKSDILFSKNLYGARYCYHMCTVQSNSSLNVFIFLLFLLEITHKRTVWNSVQPARRVCKPNMNVVNECNGNEVTVCEDGTVQNGRLKGYIQKSCGAIKCHIIMVCFHSFTAFSADIDKCNCASWYFDSFWSSFPLRIPYFLAVKPIFHFIHGKHTFHSHTDI